jgi:hypothetical protein
MYITHVRGQGKTQPDGTREGGIKLAWIRTGVLEGRDIYIGLQSMNRSFWAEKRE